MKRRWIIRGFFIFLFVMTIVLWIRSHSVHDSIYCVTGHGPVVVSPGASESTQREHIFFSNTGRCGYERLDNNVLTTDPWSTHWDTMHVPAANMSHSSWSLFRYGSPASGSGFQCGGFLADFAPHDLRIAIPIYFITSAAGFGLWFAWKKTRPPVKRRAFPVEVGETVGKL